MRLTLLESDRAAPSALELVSQVRPMMELPGVAPTLRRAPVLPSARRRDHRMGMAAPTYYTADQVRALPDDGNRYEVVHGELLVTPAPRVLHQEVIRRLLVRLSLYLDTEPVGHV